MAELTAYRLREAMTYDPETGVFVWRTRSGGKATAGTVAGTKDASGYIKIRVDGRNHYGHRLAFLYMTGEWPKQQVDHINRDRADCRWVNLRDVHHIENMRNRGVGKRNRLGVKGVQELPCGTYRARLSRDGRQRHIGTYATISEAAAAYELAGGIS